MKIFLFYEYGVENESSPKKPSLLFSSAAQAASEDGSRSPYYVQADLAYAAERITHDYPQATGANNTSTVSDYFRNIRAHSIHPRVSVGYD
ncbi:TPA: Opacity protein opA54, partial [Neisseria meningitidis]|nr:Opacity protein opA54 [Neisseria meningitidis]